MAGNAMFTIVLSRPTMNRLDEQITSTSRRRRRLSSGSSITRPDWTNLIASLQLTIGEADATQGRIAEIFVTAGQQTSIRTPPRTPPGPPPQRPPRGAPGRVLIIFNVAFCMKPAQAEHNEALGMRVTSHKPPALQHGDCPTTQKCRDQLSHR